ncbi:class I SAM-dependent methyltransferase [Desulfosporosinus sp. PR]|uniref:class I SAM-dependent methyltransferase n=1 Tax=Candidatus Desulfosporosinus nitrosoreducens TaxID=3401928 RepID=UPI0027FA7C87|nr:class I SAM-dependent methyltransferase [Desulfosporosinus sp. PR]MDQ7094858.1 class I SAM-dependent methyltransferase [Desulfosporosinus sp. PR]
MAVNSLQEYWNNRYSIEGMIWGEHPCLAAKRSVNIFMKSNSKELLVPGCGYGRNSLYLALQGFRVFGVDISDEAIMIADKIAAPRRLSLQYKCQDVLKEKIDNKFDGILSINMLHLYDKSDADIISEIYCSLLNENGVLVLTSMSVNDPDYGKGKKVANNIYESKKGRPIHYFTQTSMQELIERYFTVITIGEIKEYENHGGKEHYHNMLYVEAKKK